VSLPKSISESDELLSTADVAKQLGVHRSTVWMWVKNGMLSSVRHGSFHGISRKSLERLQGRYTVAERAKPKVKKKRRAAK
jgi:excisionase family DNA binding protein